MQIVEYVDAIREGSQSTTCDARSDESSNDSIEGKMRWHIDTNDG